MRKLSEIEAEELASDPNYGANFFMGCFNSNAPNQVYYIGDEAFLFTQEELRDDNPEYIEVVERQNKEGKEYFEFYQKVI